MAPWWGPGCARSGDRPDRPFAVQWEGSRAGQGQVGDPATQSPRGRAKHCAEPWLGLRSRKVTSATGKVGGGVWGSEEQWGAVFVSLVVSPRTAGMRRAGVGAAGEWGVGEERGRVCRRDKQVGTPCGLETRAAASLGEAGHSPRGAEASMRKRPPREEEMSLWERTGPRTGRGMRRPGWNLPASRPESPRA